MTHIFRRKHLVNRQGGLFGAGSQHTASSNDPLATDNAGGAAADDNSTTASPTTTPQSPSNTPTHTPNNPVTDKGPGGPGGGKAQDTTTTTTNNGGLIPGLGALTGSGTSTSTSLSTTSSSSVSISTTSSTTSSSSTSTSSIPSTTALLHPSTTVHSTTSIASSATSSPSTTVEPNAAVSTGTIVGIVGGSIIGVAIFACLVAFFLRRWRRKREDDEAFSASQFRRSGVMLDEDTGDDSPFDVDPRRPRPPTMIQRHMASPAIPPATYSPAPYPYGNNQQNFAYQQQQSWAPGEVMHSPISPEHDFTSPAPFLNRQPSPPAHFEAYHDEPYGHQGQGQAHYVEMDRAAATPAPAPTPLQHPGQAHYVEMDRAAATPPAPAPLPNPHGMGNKRPETVYDMEDAYGGM